MYGFQLNTIMIKVSCEKEVNGWKFSTILQKKLHDRCLTSY